MLIIMKKILSRIFSASLIAAVATTPALAQMAKKAGAATGAKANSAVTMQVTKAPAKGAKQSSKFMEMFKTRSLANTGSKGLKSAQTGAVSLKSTKQLAPAKEAGAMPEMNGMIIFNDDIAAKNSEAGLYKIPSNGTDAPEVIVPGFSAYGGVCVDGIYYATGYTTFFGYIMTIDYYVVDVDSEEIVAHLDLDDMSGMCSSMAYDKTTGTVYAFGFNADASAINFQKLNLGTTGVSVDVIASADRNWNSIAFDKEGQLWGISYVMEGDNVGMSTLCKIDKTTGAVTEVGETGVKPQYMSSSVIDPESGRMFWNVCPADETGSMYEVDMTTGAASFLYQLKYNDEIMGMYIPGPAAEDKAPAECKNVSINFEDGSLNGTCTLTTPATLFDGTQGSGELIISVMANGDQIGYAEAAWNSSVTIDLDMSTMGRGLYDFLVFASNEVGMGPRTKVKGVYVGPDSPVATTATLKYENGNMEVSWLPVTESVNGGYMDLSKLSYTVKDADGNVKAEGLTTTSWSEAVAEPEDLTTFQYQVEVVCDGIASTPALTNLIVLGSVNPPYTSNYEENGLEGWTILDNNGDGKAWSVSGSAIRMAYNSDVDMDDWAITMPIKLEAGKAYSFSFDTWAQSANYPETLEVKFGKENTAAGMTETLLEPTEVAVVKADAIHVDKMIVPAESGIYYVGFHGISAADTYYLYVGDFTIGEGVSALAPGEGKIAAVANPNGETKAAVTVTFADKTLNGQTLSSLTKAEVYRDEELIKTYENPAVGGVESFVDELELDGFATYDLVCYNAEGKGIKASTTVFVGFDKPEAVAAASIANTSNPGEVTVTWSPVTLDVNGKTYPAGAVKYKLATYETTGWVPFTEELDGTSYTYQAVAAGEQDFVQVAVFPFYNDVNGSGAVTDMIPSGTPYDGIDETFADGTLNYIWGLNSAATEFGAGGGSADICTSANFDGIDGVDGDNGYVNLKGSNLNSSILFFSGMVSLDQMVNPGFTFYVYNINDGTNPNINLIDVYVKDLSTDNADWVLLKSAQINELCGAASASEIGEEGWGKVSVNLSSYANKTIQVGVESVVKYYTNNFIDNLKVGSILGHDLKAKGIAAPSKVKAGQAYDVTVTVANEGAQTADAYSVELYADEELVATKSMTNLESGKSASVVFDREMSALATEPVSYYAKVIYAADENEANNQTKSITVDVVVSTLPAATGLTGSCSEGNVVLTWNEPNIEGGVGEPVTYDFEDGDAFASEYGDWTFVDVDGGEVGGFQNMDVPGITPGTTKGSFWVWDQSVAGNQTFEAHSGTKYLFALFMYDDSQSDDWAISPELDGSAQTISFYARSYSATYPEKISVYYSTSTSVEPADYVMVEGSTVNAVPGDWTLYEVSLPAGAKHFAIRSYATSSFMLMVDDVTFIPAEGSTANLEIAGYNVYRDGVKINSDLVQECTFTDSNVTEGQTYTYVVTVVYTERGESAASNEAVVTAQQGGVAAIGDGSLAIYAAKGGVVVLNAEGVNVTVASANGAVVFDGKGEAKTEISTGAGVFVVKAGNAVKKVVVK